MHFQATADELRDVWGRFPHARWIFEREAHCRRPKDRGVQEQP